MRDPNPPLPATPAEVMDVLRARLLAAVPDAPRTLALRALLLDPTSAIGGHAYAAVVSSACGRVLALHGKPSPERIASALADRAGGWSLIAGSRRDEIAGGLRWRRVDLATLARPAAVADAAGDDDDDVEVRPLDEGRAADAGRAGVSAASRAVAVAIGGALCAVVDGRAVSVAHAARRTERHFEVAVETAPAHRRRGLGRRLAARLILAERAQGRLPVWSALDDDPASLALAAALGFSRMDSIWIGDRLRAS